MTGDKEPIAAPPEGAVRAALARIAGVKTVRLTTRGRKTGTPRAVTIWFVVDGDAIGLGTLNEDRHWVKNARANPEVELDIDGTRFAGRLHDNRDAAAHERVRSGMARKYWPARIASWFGIGQKHSFRVDGLSLR
jgi:deazaflavin-dependent oxidoreductase (nitroreductase family)